MSGTHRFQMNARNNHFNAHHVVRNQFEVPIIDLDVVDAKDAAHLPYNSCPSHLYAVCSKDGVDIVGIDIVLLDQRFLSRTCELP
jgi:hypothetical protein